MIQKCYNDGEVFGKNNVGGILGNLEGASGQGTVIECYNKGKVTGTTNIGEVIGINGENSLGLNTLNKLFYLTNTRGLTAIGGKLDNETNKIKGVSNNLNYEQFKIWITEQ